MSVPQKTGRVQRDVQVGVTSTAWLVPVPTQIAALQQWVIFNRLEDDDFFKLLKSSRTKKAEWVAFVQRKLSSMP
jgi:hypothetical protein